MSREQCHRRQHGHLVPEHRLFVILDSNVKACCSQVSRDLLASWSDVHDREGARVVNDSRHGLRGLDPNGGRHHARGWIGASQKLDVLDAVEERDHEGVAQSRGRHPIQGLFEMRRLHSHQHCIHRFREPRRSLDGGGEVAETLALDMNLAKP